MLRVYRHETASGEIAAGQWTVQQSVEGEPWRDITIGYNTEQAARTLMDRADAGLKAIIEAAEAEAAEEAEYQRLFSASESGVVSPPPERQEGGEQPGGNAATGSVPDEAAGPPPGRRLPSIFDGLPPGEPLDLA